MVTHKNHIKCLTLRAFVFVLSASVWGRNTARTTTTTGTGMGRGGGTDFVCHLLMVQLEHTKCVCWKLSCGCCCCCCRWHHKGFLIIAPNYNRQSHKHTDTQTHRHSYTCALSVCTHKLRIRLGTLKQKPQQCEVAACVVWLGFSLDSGSILFAAVFAFFFAFCFCCCFYFNLLLFVVIWCAIVCRMRFSLSPTTL